MVPKQFVMVHHSATVDSRTFSTQAIRYFHTSWRFEGQIISEQRARALLAQGIRGVIAPWRKIGYTRIVELVNGEYECIVGRGDHEGAAACPQDGMNERALHICIVGNFDQAPPPEPALRVAIERAIAPWRMVHGIPVENVIGHRDRNPAKTCPGKRFDLELLREMLR